MAAPEGEVSVAAFPNQANLIAAIRNWSPSDVKRVLRERGVWLNNVGQNRNNIPLMVAVDVGSMDIIEVLIQNGANVNVTDDCEMTPLIQAICENKIAIAQRLLENGADMDYHDSTGQTALHKAAMNKNIALKTVLWLLNRDEDTEHTDDVKEAAAAVAERHRPHIAFIIRNYISPRYERPPDYEQNLLLAAVETNLIEAVKYALTNTEVDLNPDDEEYDRHPLLLAAHNGCEEIVKILLREGAGADETDKHGAGVLHHALHATTMHNLSLIGLLLDNGLDIDYQNADGNTALHLAVNGAIPETIVIEERTEIVKFLLDHGADATIYNNKKETAESIARKKGLGYLADFLRDYISQTPEAVIFSEISPEHCLAVLLQAIRVVEFRGIAPVREVLNEIELNPSDLRPWYRHPLALAGHHGSVEVVKLLLKKGADVAMPCDRNRLPFCYAVTQHNLDVAQLLLDNGSYINDQDADGFTALHCVIANGKGVVTGTVKWLLERGADKSLETSHGETAEFLAHVRKFNKTATLIQNYVMNPDVVLVKLAAPGPVFANQHRLLEAIKSDRSSSVRQVLQEGDVNLAPTDQTWDGCPLLVAAQRGLLNIVQLLMRRGASAAACDVHGTAALGFAIGGNHLEVAQTLLAGGANINSQDNFHRTALHLVADGRWDGVTNATVKWLLDHGVDKSLKNKNGFTAERCAREGKRSNIADIIAGYIPNTDEVLRLHVQLERAQKEVSEAQKEISEVRSAEILAREQVVTILNHSHSLAREVDASLTEATEARVRALALSFRLSLQNELRRHETDNHTPLYNLKRELRRTMLSDYQIQRQIGESINNRGSYGVNARVYKVLHGDRSLVLKAMINPHGAQANDTSTLEDLFAREYDLPCAPHTCIMPILHWFKDSPSTLPDWPAPLDHVARRGRQLRTVFVVSPLYDGNLSTASRLRRETDHVSERWLLGVMCPLLRGVQHLVRHDVLHMDLKLDNVLVRNAAYDAVAPTGVSADLDVVLGDFGCSLHVDSGDITAVPRGEVLNRGGNPPHRAPEFRSADRIIDLSKAELWAVGVMMHELVSDEAESPFGDQAPAAYVLGPEHMLPYADRWPRLAQLVQAMLACLPRDRINVDDAVRLAHALLYAAPLENIVDEGAEAVVEAWRDARLATLHQVMIDAGIGVAPASNGASARLGAGAGAAAGASVGVGSLSLAWRAETEYLCALEVPALIAAARQWLV